MVTVKQQLIGWIRALRIQFVIGYIILGAGGIVIGSVQFHTPINILQEFIAFSIIILAAIGINFRDEASDWVAGYDKEHGGAGVIRENLLTVKSLQTVGILANFISLLLATIQAWLYPSLIYVLIPIFIVIVGANYITEKITLGHEIGPAFSFAMCVLWTYFSQGWQLTEATIWFVIFAFILVFALVAYQDTGDYDADKKSGKKTLTVRLGLDAVGQLSIGLALIGLIILYITISFL
jgi:1,4-dihydroxy-2-naphthoate octaprenyltransferase